MFTGLIEELGEIVSIKKGPKSAVLNIACEIAESIKIGESVAVNGVCLTAVKTSKNYFSAEVMDETLKKTILGNLKSGSLVNLERALRLSDRLDGHLVSGHIDGLGIIESVTQNDIANVFKILTSEEIMYFLVPKGSIAIDGISLTLVDIGEDFFTVSLIPHTSKMTTLGFKNKGDTVNLEVDMLAKYVKNFLDKTNSKQEKETNITLDMLAENGFI